jgi:PhoPQ-activated pathogenicity-related protein
MKPLPAPSRVRACSRSAGHLAIWLAVTVLIAFPSAAQADGLVSYVSNPDPSYNWKRCEQTPVKDATLTHLELVSQTWQNQFWSHHLMVIRPNEVKSPDIALLFVTGGSYNGPSEKDMEPFLLVAQRAGAIVGVINKVPNQPLYDGKREDALIAFTFDQYTKTGDETWPLLFPMVKSAVRGMDTLQTFAQQEWKQKIERFVISGASKRGWTTWLSAAVDPRVVGIAPMVIDMLNMKVQLDWSHKMYGRQSEEIDDYTRIRFHERIDEPAVVKLRGWVDPYSYRNRYKMPKLILLGTNDPYWVVDSLRHYWNDLPGPKLVFQTPNAGHDLGGAKDAVQTLAAFFRMIAQHQAPPSMDWAFAPAQGGKAGGVKVQVSAAPKRVVLWTAESKDRDFRDEKWTDQPVAAAAGERSFSAEVSAPASGYRAYMMEVTLTGTDGNDYRLSTEARVLPDILP